MKPGGAVTVTAEVATWLVAPSLSIAVRVTVNVPGVVYVCDGVLPVPLVPSPKFQAYVNPAAVSSGPRSVAVPWNVRGWLIKTVYGPPARAVGATLEAVTVVVVVDVFPNASVTRSPT